MPDSVTNCAQIRKQMLDAITDSLSVGKHAGFDAHLGGCNSCRDEFHRVQTLLQAIDRTLSANLAAEPSAQLVANVRQSIAARPHGAAAWRRWRGWATAAGVCAAVALLFVVARTSRKLNLPLHDSAAVQTSASLTSKLISHPTLNSPVDALAAQQRKPAPTGVLRTSLRTNHRNAAEREIVGPEIIVQPGQMQAIFQLIAETQRGQLDGASLLNNERKATEPPEIKPLKIVPLRISPSKDDAETSAPSSQDRTNIAVARQSN